MKLHLTKAEGNQLITGYDDSWVAINYQRYEQNIIVMPTEVILDWPAKDFDTLESHHLEQLLQYKPEVVLLGTGKKHRFIHPKLCKALTEVGVSVECMDTPAACRTYNILMSEGRHVLAALLL